MRSRVEAIHQPRLGRNADLVQQRPLGRVRDRIGETADRFVVHQLHSGAGQLPRRMDPARRAVHRGAPADHAPARRQAQSFTGNFRSVGRQHVHIVEPRRRRTDLKRDSQAFDVCRRAVGQEHGFAARRLEAAFFFDNGNAAPRQMPLQPRQPVSEKRLRQRKLLDLARHVQRITDQTFSAAAQHVPLTRRPPLARRQHLRKRNAVFSENPLNVHKVLFHKCPQADLFSLSYEFPLKRAKAFCLF